MALRVISKVGLIVVALASVAGCYMLPETSTPTRDLVPPSGFEYQGSGYATKRIEGAPCGEGKFGYCLTFEVLALRDCLPTTFDLMILDSDGNLLANVTDDLPAMEQGNRQAANLTWSPQNYDEVIFPEIQSLRCETE